MKPKSRFDYVDATQGTARIASANDGGLGGSEAENAFKIANRCREMLLRPITPWPQEDMPRVYRQAALERGFSEGFLGLSHAKFEDAFIAFYGESLLSRLGCGFQMGKDTNWVRGIFRERVHLRAFHPLQHALVQVFLEGAPIDASKKNPIGLGPWKCPNPYAAHEEQLPIKWASRRILPSGEFAASTKCGCGFCFTFSRTSDTDSKLPIVKYTRGLGSTWEAEAERLRRSGLGTSAIAKKMGIDFKTAQRLLEKKPPAVRSRPAQMEELKREWLKLLDQVPGRRRNLARSLNDALYARLRRWDRDWLLAQPEYGNARHTPKRTVDWVNRDREWSKVLRATAKKVKASGLLRRITPTTIMNASGLSPSVPHFLDRLPMCQAALNEYSESSLDDSRERRLRAAVDKGRERGLPPKDWVLRKLSGLSGRELSPKLNAVLQALVSDLGN